MHRKNSRWLVAREGAVGVRVQGGVHEGLHVKASLSWQLQDDACQNGLRWLTGYEESKGSDTQLVVLVLVEVDGLNQRLKLQDESAFSEGIVRASFLSSLLADKVLFRFRIRFFVLRKAAFH